MNLRDDTGTRTNPSPPNDVDQRSRRETFNPDVYGVNANFFKLLAGQYDVLNDRVTAVEKNVTKILCGCDDDGHSDSDEDVRDVRDLLNEVKDWLSERIQTGTALPYDADDIFQLVCSNTPQNRDVISYLFDEKAKPMSVLVEFVGGTSKWKIRRREMLSLLPKTSIYEDVIDCVAFYIWREAYFDENKINNWNLPASFSNYACNPNLHDLEVEASIFGENNNFRSISYKCRRINIPINHNDNHWYLCTVDLVRRKILIYDTYEAGEEEARMTKSKHVVERLERIAKQWDGFEAHDWASTFEWEKTHCFQQPDDSRECGLYVILKMMYPDACHRQLTEEEAVATRQRLATLLYTTEHNKAERGTMFSYAVAMGTQEVCYGSFDSNEVTVEESLNYLIKGLYLDSRDGDKELLGISRRGGDLIKLQTDDELRLFVKTYTDVGMYFVKVQVI